MKMIIIKVHRIFSFVIIYWITQIASGQNVFKIVIPPLHMTTIHHVLWKSHPGFPVSDDVGLGVSDIGVASMLELLQLE